MKLWNSLDVALPISIILLLMAVAPLPHLAHQSSPGVTMAGNTVVATNATQNFSAALNRLVLIVAAAAGAVVTLAWARVAVSWFSNDPTKKMTAKDRVRDAALGTFILMAAVSGLAWGLAHWVLTGS